MKIQLSKFSKFYKSISSEWVAAVLVIFSLAYIMPRVGKVWSEENTALWILFFPMLLLRNLATTVAIPPERGMIVLLLLGAPLVVLYWSFIFWGLSRILRLVAGNHLGR